MAPSAAPAEHGDPLAGNWIDRAIGRRSEGKLLLGLIAFAIVLRVLMFGMGYAALQSSPNARDGPTKSASAPTDGLGEAYDKFLSGDTGWYLSVADNGYEERNYTGDREANWGFFPGWPMLIAAGSFLVGGKSLLAALLLASICSLAAIPLLYRLLRLDWSPGIAFGSVVAYWPGSTRSTSCGRATSPSSCSCSSGPYTPPARSDGGSRALSAPSLRSQGPLAFCCCRVSVSSC
ncbi:MAG TPA: hypothetical protein VHP57_11460 [Acidimicrobiia bacterium]|nr:hypothetical protein [Acidimicrobiia bacterium]